MVKHPLIKLTKTQKKHYESVKWLLNDGPIKKKGEFFAEQNRQTGRSVLMMAVLLEVAMTHRKRWYRIADHCSMELLGRSQDHNFMSNLQEWVKKLDIHPEEGRFEFDRKKLRFRFV